MTSFSWEVSEPFSILPPAGSIPPRGSCSLKAVFRPVSASVFEASAVCCYGEKNLIKEMKLGGVGNPIQIYPPYFFNLCTVLNTGFDLSSQVNFHIC